MVLRAVREARGLTLDGWAAHIGVSRATVQRWERGTRAPDPGAEAAIVAYCREKGLFRAYDRGPLAGLTLSPELLEDLLTEARWRGSGTATGTTPQLEPPRLEHPDNLGLQTAAGSPSNLPAALTTFVGREQELTALSRLLANTRLITLTGVGGCGKTRLALQVAGELLWAYPDGVFLVELASLANPALVPESIRAALDLHASGDRPVAAALHEQLAPRHLLLLLDNCEHLLPACAGVVEALLRACPHLTVLATSRESLGIAGETVWRVHPLALADATRLFVERSRLYQPDMELSSETEAVIEEICARLDGIPLAIELIAARVRALSVEQIAERLNDRFQLLTGGSRTALPRHQTLRASLDWSHDLLTQPERALLRRLAVFAGGFTLEAAEHIVSLRIETQGRGAKGAADSLPAEDVLSTISSLVDKSLVFAQHRGGAVRYGLLETIRQYAGEQLEAAEESVPVRDRHRDWFLSLAAQTEAARYGPAEWGHLLRLHEEHDNLRTALRWSLLRGKTDAETALRLAGVLARFWELRGHLSEGRQWLEEALAVGGRAPAALRAGALLGAGRLAYAQGDYGAARSLHERSLLLSRQLGDTKGIADAQRELGMVALRVPDYAAARAWLEGSLALHVELGNTPGIASVQSALGFLALRLGDHAAARAHLEVSVVLRRELGDRQGLADALDDLATIAGAQGDSARLAAVLEESLALYRELGATGGVARVLNYLGMNAWMQGDHDRALALMEESLALYRNRGEARGIAGVLGNLSLVALSRRDFIQAIGWCRESLARYRDSGDPWGAGRFLPVLAGAAFGQGQGEKAARLCGAAAALRERLGTPLPPAVQPNHDRMIAVLRRTLGEQAFINAWEAGAAMTWEAAVADALADAPSG